MIKKISFIYLIFLFSFISSTFGQVSVSLSSRNFSVGDTEQVIMTVNEANNKPQFIDFPQINGIRWLLNSRQESTNIINSSISTSISINFLVEKPGKYQLNGIKYRYKNQELTANLGEIEVKISDKAFLQIAFNNSQNIPKKLYVGETVFMDIFLFVDNKYDSQNGNYPEISFSDGMQFKYVVLHQNHANQASVPFHDQQRAVLVNVNGVEYIRHRFYIAFAPLKTGIIAGSVTQNWNLLDSNSNKSDNQNNLSFFFNRVNTKSTQVSLNLPRIPVENLPNAPANSGYFLGLVGDFSGSIRLNKNEVKVGEAISLILDLKSALPIQNFDLDFLKIPELKLDGFRVYAGEVLKDNLPSETVVQISWLLVPLSEKSKIDEINFCTFNSKTETFNKISANLPLKINPADITETYTTTNVVTGNNKNNDKNFQVASNLLFLKKNSQAAININIYENSVFFVIVTIFTIILLVIIFLFLRKRLKTYTDESFARCRMASRNRGKIIKGLQKEEHLASFITRDFVAWLIDLKRLNKGTSVSELSEKITDKKLVEQLHLAESAQYISGNNEKIERDFLVKSAKKITLFFFILLTSFGFAQENNNTFSAAMKLYEEMNYKESYKLFSELHKENIEEGKIDSSVCYNLGNCAYSLGNKAESLAWFETAKLLSPRDYQINENLNFVKKELGQKKELTLIQLFLSQFKKLRPDEWLDIALTSMIIGFILLFFSFVLNRRKLTGFVICLNIFIGATICSFYVYQSNYKSNEKAIILSKSNVYKLPQNSGKELFKVLDGKEVEVLENRELFCLIRVDKKSEGWIEKNKIQFIYP